MQFVLLLKQLDGFTMQLLYYFHCNFDIFLVQLNPVFTYKSGSCFIFIETTFTGYFKLSMSISTPQLLSS